MNCQFFSLGFFNELIRIFKMVLRFRLYILVKQNSTGFDIGLARSGYIGYAAMFTILVCAAMLVIELTGFGKSSKKAVKMKILKPEDLNFPGAFDGIFEKYSEKWMLKPPNTAHSLNNILFYSGTASTPNSSSTNCAHAQRQPEYNLNTQSQRRQGLLTDLAFQLLLHRKQHSQFYSISTRKLFLSPLYRAA